MCVGGGGGGGVGYRYCKGWSEGTFSLEVRTTCEAGRDRSGDMNTIFI